MTARAWAMLPFTLDPVRDADREHLDRALSRHPWEDIPCRAGTLDPVCWISDGAPAALAADECQRCPGLDQCRAYIETHWREAGTYGGMTERERHSTSTRKSA